MTNTESREISGSDIESVAQKLLQLHQTLSPNEQQVLDWLMSRAAQADEAQGYALFDFENDADFSKVLGLSSPVSRGGQYFVKYAVTGD
jgi:hypothetical protein